MSSVAYPTQPSEPGRWGTAWLMFLGWLTAALVLGGLYLAGAFAGVIGRNGYTGPGFGVHAINDWPFSSNGRWSLFADLSVFVLALGVSTIAIAWQLRGPFATVSEGRLLVVLFFTGGAPFVTSEDGAPLYFVIAVFAVRAWVVNEELRVRRWALLATGVLLVLTIASYGLFHPLWIESASSISSQAKQKRPTVVVMLHNSSRASVELERVSAGGFTDVRGGWPLDRTHLPLLIAGGHTEAFALKALPGTCGSGLIAELHYRVFGRTLHEPLRLTLPELPC